MLTKKELGIPWKDTGMEWVGSALGDADAVDVNKKPVHFKDKADFILHAVNNYHALVEALEKIGQTKNMPAIHTQTWECQANEWQKAYWQVVNIAKALLATHTQEEARQDKDTAHIAIDNNKVTTTTVCSVCRQPSDQCDGGLKKMTEE